MADTDPRIETIREALDDPDAYAREAHILRRQGINKPPARAALDSLAADLEAARGARRLMGFARFNLGKGKTNAAATLIEKADAALARLSAGKETK